MYVFICLGDICRGESARSHGNSTFKLLKIAKLFYKVVARFYISTVHKVFSFFLSLPTLVIFCHFDYSHLSEVVYQWF